MASEWHFTTILDLVDHWQTVIAGLLALAAAIIAIIVTIRIEGGKARIEDKALRASLAVELRLMLARAYGAHTLFRGLAEQTTPITRRQVKSFSQLPAPVVYPATADRIGLLGESAMEVVMFYGVLEVLKGKCDELQTHRTPDAITPALVAGLGEGFLQACKSGLPLLGKLKTGMSLHDSKDAELVRLIGDALLARKPPA